MLSILPQQSGFPLPDMVRSPDSPARDSGPRGLFEEFLREARIGAESTAAVPREDREISGEDAGEDSETAVEAFAIAAGLLVDTGEADKSPPLNGEKAPVLPEDAPGEDGEPAILSLWAGPQGKAPEVSRVDGALRVEGEGPAEEGPVIVHEGPDAVPRTAEVLEAAGTAEIPRTAEVFEAAGIAGIAEAAEKTGEPGEERRERPRGGSHGGVPAHAGAENAGQETGPETAEKISAGKAGQETAALEQAAGQPSGGEAPPFPPESFAAAAPQSRPEPEAPSRSPAVIRGLQDLTGSRETSPRIREEGPEKTEKAGSRAGRKRFTLELRDYRTETPERGAPVSASSETELPQSRNTLFANLELDGVTEKTAGNGGGGEAGETGGFEESLARELRQNLNGDIVRRAQVILRDGGEGLIRLSLKPESLGTVKIRLELTENKIVGHIIVESDEALKAFEREIASLEQAFRDSGYESAELGASLSQDGRGSGEGGAGEGPFYSPRFAAEQAASRYDEIWEWTDAALSGDSEGSLLPGNRHISVNMLI